MSDSFQILRPSLMRSSRRLVCSSSPTSSQYFSRMIPESSMAFSTPGTAARKDSQLLVGAETHHALDARPVVIAAVEDHDLRRGGEMRQISLDIHLRLFALGRRRQRDDPERARADALGDRLDHAALAGAVAALEDDADLLLLGAHPFLQLHEFDMQAREFAIVDALFQRLSADRRDNGSIVLRTLVLVLLLLSFLLILRPRRSTPGRISACRQATTLPCYFQVRNKPASPGNPLGHSTIIALRP